MWHVDTDAFPRSLYVLRDENGETLKTDTAPGWYRTNSLIKAARDCARLNAAEAKVWSEQETAEIAAYAARLRKERGLKAQNRRKIGVLRRSIAAWRSGGLMPGEPLTDYGREAVERQEREIRARLAAEKLAKAEIQAAETQAAETAETTAA